MADAAAMVVHNAEAPWNEFSPEEYRRHNYAVVQPEDREIMARVSRFLIRSFSGRKRAERAIDVGSGPNLYPALLMLPWTDHLLLADFSINNVGWLGYHVLDEDAPWHWHEFWRELDKLDGYNRITDPRKHLREACNPVPGRAGVEQRSVFDLPKATWQLGTMFFVAESITQDAEEFGAAISAFGRALEPGAPFAATFMAGSGGYEIAGTNFPAFDITADDVKRRFHALGARDLDVYQNQTKHRVRKGYQGMIVATGFAGDQ